MSSMNRLSLKEAAQAAGMCVSTLRLWVRSGDLPHYRLGAPGRRGKIVIDIADLDAFLEQLKVVKQEPAPKSAPAPKFTFKHLRLG